MDASLNKIKNLVKQKIGLDSSTIGDTTIDSIIQQRMQLCEINDYESYFTLLNNNQAELSELLEITVIPETWFFRDIRPFEIIYKKIQQKLITDQSTRFRILSLPSSTGEEPYSLAIYLIDKGINESAFAIDAVDISKRALRHAQQGIYGKNSFRGKDYPAYQNKYFKKDESTYKVNNSIREKIKFYNLNILHNDNSLKHEFDFILCRNLLIYFDLTTKLIAFKNLADFLKKDGYLFIGHSEFGSVPAELFQNTGFEQAFALIRHNHPDFKPAQIASSASTQKIRPIRPDVNVIKPQQKSIFETLINKTTHNNSASENETSLATVRELTNTKQFDKAESICLQYIRNNDEDAEVLFLMGLISNSRHKEKDAESYFRKSLFLEPKHYDTLIHLALILQKNGDKKNSELLKQRAERAFEESKN